ncbi:hypothetical protein PR048_000301 [Dryococelus australis]|uniref:Uncharacterized protein n=1 Tax=Dryococelus australis TaxID=614101 RepID=A0ABQ9IE90_9NEOP|nr:hypothetical protein PR048_000301 [Dryococelus australis]
MLYEHRAHTNTSLQPVEGWRGEEEVDGSLLINEANTNLRQENRGCWKQEACHDFDLLRGCAGLEVFRVAGVYKAEEILDRARMPTAQVLVGAPEAQARSQPSVVRGGAVYQCNIDRDDHCREMVFDRTAGSTEIRQRLTRNGAEMQPAGQDINREVWGTFVDVSTLYRLFMVNTAGPTELQWVPNHVGNNRLRAHKLLDYESEVSERTVALPACSSSELDASASPTSGLDNDKTYTTVAQRLENSRPTKANRVRIPAWESCWTMPLVGRFSRGSPLPRPFIPAVLHIHLASPSSALKTSMLRGISPCRMIFIVFRHKLDFRSIHKRVEKLGISKDDVESTGKKWTWLMTGFVDTRETHLPVPKHVAQYSVNVNGWKLSSIDENWATEESGNPRHRSGSPVPQVCQ